MRKGRSSSYISDIEEILLTLDISRGEVQQDDLCGNVRLLGYPVDEHVARGRPLEVLHTYKHTDVRRDPEMEIERLFFSFLSASVVHT
jgi:hypothetical protein